MASGRREIPFALTADNRTQAAFRSLRNDVRQVNALGRTFAGVFGGVFAATTFSGFLRSIPAVIDGLDEAAKSARTLGIEVNQLQGFQFAGNILGLDDRDVSRTLRQVRAFQQRIAVGSTEGATDLNRAAARALGLSVDTLRAQDAESASRRIVSALANIRNQTLRTNLAIQIAGSRGADGLLRLAEGAESGQLEPLIRESRTLFGNLNNLAAQAEAVSDVFTRLGAAISGAGADALAAVLPDGTDIERAGIVLSQTLVNFRRNLDIGDLLLSPLFGLLNQLGVAVDRANEFADEFRRAQRDAQRAAPALQQLAGAIPVDDARAFNDQLSNAGRQVEARALEALGAGVPEADFEPITRSLSEAEQAAIGVEFAINDGVNATLDLARAADTAAQAYQDLLDNTAAQREQERLARLERSQAIRETALLERSARTLLSARQDDQGRGREVTGTASQLAQAVVNAQQQAQDPGVQVLERILSRLEQEKAAAAVESLKETIGRLNNPVFN